jgi:hypothetical protein
MMICLVKGKNEYLIIIFYGTDIIIISYSFSISGGMLKFGISLNETAIIFMLQKTTSSDLIKKD